MAVTPLGLGILTPAVAHAATPIACVINGNTTSLTPIPAPPATGGTGTFAFSGSATCTVGTATVSTTVSASGTYVNIVCGTGSADGTATFGDPRITTKGFHIEFAAGAGTLTITSGGTGGGNVDILPSNTGGCVTAATTGFTVTATVAGSQ